MKIVALLALSAVLLLVPTDVAVSQESVFVETFDDPALPGWEVDGGDVVDGVLRMNPGGFAFHPLSADDFALQIRFRRSGPGDALVHYRFGEAGSYAVRLGEAFAAVQRHLETADEIARAEPVDVSEEWATLTIVVRGPDHTILVDDQPVIELSDPQSFVGDSIVLRVEGDAAVEFDDLIVEAFDVSATTTTSTTVAAASTTTTDTTVAAADELTWIRTGGPFGGLGYDVRMHPDNPDLMYVTDAFAGVFISADGGKTWSPSNEGITTRVGLSGDAIPVFSLTIDQNEPDTIWVGTQESRGIYKSIDGGRTWVEKTNGIVEVEGITVRGFAVDPTDSDVVYTAAEISSWVWAGEERKGQAFDMTAGVVYKTTDGGENWSPVWRGQNLARYVWIDPRDTDVLIISTGIFDRDAANSDHVAGIPGGEGVLKSIDGGSTWNRVNEGIGNLYVGTLFMHPQNPDTLLAGSHNLSYAGGDGVYLTTDGGASWDHVLADGTTSVEFSLSDPTIAYAGSQGGIHRSDDSGRTWQRVSRDIAHWGPPGVNPGFPIDLQVDPRDSMRIFLNAYGGGNFVSEDGGTTWAIASRGYTGVKVGSLAVDPVEPSRAFVAAESGLFTTPDGGATWVVLSSEPATTLSPVGVIAVDPDDPLHLIAGTSLGLSLGESTDGGVDWTQVHTDPDESIGWRDIAFAASDPTTVYAGSATAGLILEWDDHPSAAGIYVSQDGGSHWRLASGPRDANVQVTDLDIHPTDPRTAFAAAKQDGLLATTDGGETWEEIPTGAGTHTLTLSIAVDQLEPRHMLAGFSPGGIRSSDDGGTTWTSATGFFPESAIGAIVFDPTDPTIVYASDLFSGVYRSADGGRSWTAINEGLRTRAVAALAITSDGNHLYAGTLGEGVYRLDLAGSPPPTAPPSGVGDTEPSTTVATDATAAATTAPPTEPGASATPAAGTSDNDAGGGSGIALIVGAVILLIAVVGGVALWRRRSP